MEHQTPMAKCYPSLTLDDIRYLSGTHFISKQYESFISDWNLPIVEHFLDRGQCRELRNLQSPTS